jgi:hypothetical protein
MSHFAWVKDGVVAQVLVADSIDDLAQITPAAATGQWIQTSYNTRGGVHYRPDSDIPSADQSKALRKNFAGIGFAYDADLDAFIPPKDYPSWILNRDTCLWEPPTARPEGQGPFDWNEATATWVAASL